VNQAPLRPLHPDHTLIVLKLEQFRNVSTDELCKSLAPGQTGSLKVSSDGTILDGHHRIKVLRERGFGVERLPREIVRLG